MPEMKGCQVSNDAHGAQQPSYTDQGFLIPDQGDKHLQRETRVQTSQ